MPLYFAYGLNMDATAMAERCPKAKQIGLARLPRHRFFIMADGFASVMRDPRREVLGVLWDLPFADIAPLDRFERVHDGLYVKISQPVIVMAGSSLAATGATRRALIYVGGTTTYGKPRPGYLEAVVAAAREQGLPETYLYELAHGEPAPRKPGMPLFRAPV